MLLDGSTPALSQAPPGAAGELSLPAVADNVPALRRAIVGAARADGAADTVCRRIALAVSEAATNAVLHAFPEGRPGRVRASILDRGDAYEVEVADDGRGLTLRDDSPGLGMGLGLIAEVADDLAIRSEPGQGTAMRMLFAHAPGA